MEDIYLIDEKGYVENISLEANSRDELKISSYNFENNKTEEVDNIERIEEILEIKIENNLTKFSAFGVQTGNWIELKFKNISYRFVR
jgi:hypothetical protein